MITFVPSIAWKCKVCVCMSEYINSIVWPGKELKSWLNKRNQVSPTYLYVFWYGGLDFACV